MAEVSRKNTGRGALWGISGILVLLGIAIGTRYGSTSGPGDGDAIAADGWKGAGEGMRWNRPDAVVNGEHNEYPDVAIDDTGYLWTVWVGYPDGVERIYVQRRLAGFRGGGDQFRLGDGRGPTGWPRIATSERFAWVTWAEQTGGRFQVRLASFDGEKLLKIDPVSTPGRDAVRPAIAIDREGQPWVAWEELRGTRIVLMARRMPRQDATSPLEIDDSGELNLRAALARGPGSSMMIAWDHYENGQYDIRLREVQPGRLEPPVWVTSDRFVDQAPALLSDEDRVWIGWHTSRNRDGSGARPGRGLFLAAWEDGHLRLPTAGAPPTMTQLPDRPELDECLEFPSIARDKAGRIYLFARRGQGYVGMYLSGDRWSAPVDISEPGWGGRGRDLRVAVDRRGTLHMVARWLHKVGYSVLTPSAAAASPIGLGTPLALSGLGAPGISGMRPKPGPSSPDSGNDASAGTPRTPLTPAATPTPTPVAARPTAEAASGSRPFFGDVHTHTWLSDASGEPDEVFTRARDILGHDFVALTDHDVSNGNRLAPFEWAWEQLLSNFFNRPGSFVTLLAYEWTSMPVAKGGAGHRNVYFPGDRAPLFSVDIDAPNTLSLYDLLRGTGAFAVPHHTSWTGTDWENFDQSLQPLFEVVSVHGNSERADGQPIVPRVGDGGSYAVEGFRRGLRFGFVGGSDGHGLPWHYGVSRQEDVWTTGMTGVYAPKLERSAILAQLKKRSCFATSGAQIELWIEYRKQGMGAEVQADGAHLEIRAKVRGTAPLKTIELVRNGETDKRLEVPAGRTVHEAAFKTAAPAGTSGWYLRVVQVDKSMAWSSPIWIKR